jgi:hypothetical protein
MDRVELDVERSSKAWLIVGAIVLVTVAIGCHSRSSGTGGEFGSQSPPGDQALQSDLAPGTADFCQETMSKDPTVPFHFSSVRAQQGTNDTISVEADVSPQTIDLTNRSPVGTTTNHYRRADKTGWAAAVTRMAMSSPWMDRNMAKFNISRMGPEKVNGFQAIRYAVDTRNDPSNKQGYLQAMGLKNYDIVGSLWLTEDTGCILKYAIDDTDYSKNGAVTKIHYEGGIAKR